MTDLEKRYDPKAVDKKWYSHWEGKGLFKANAGSDKPPYTIVMPPPNVTGQLHMGHALVSTVQDILIRWKRMSGFEALWIPGVDHAGIATQTVVERHLIATEGKRRKEYSREEFLSHVWDWKGEKEEVIKNQLRAMGASCDWDRYRFTMDEVCSKEVRTIFKRLFDQGLIYQGDYLVNWDPVTQTALADDEVEYIDRDTFMWTIRYPLADGSGHILIATTRPECMLGDTAVAVAPGDERYAHLVGKQVRLPITERLIPIIADHHVDPEFGTGAVKITPAHDPNDYQMAARHDLELINIMTPDGRMNEVGGDFAGLTMDEARLAIVQRLKAMGILEGEEKHTHRVGLSYRSKAVIEPYISKQWFIRMDGFAKKLHSAVTDSKVRIVPKQWENTYFHWVDNLRDWCISRQLWWGHQIPIWYNKENPDQMICHGDVGLPPEVEANPDAWEQDPDALDTWFSSALWPFSTLQGEDREKFYPNNVLVTGHDIIFFWVARMICMGEYAMEEVPFPDTFIHGLIYGKSYWRDNPDGGITYCDDEERKGYDLGKEIPKDVHWKWEKQSKSKGNVIDPREIVEEYGTDAMRMALVASAPQNSQIDLDRRRFEDFRNFTNKIWNGARFVFMNLDISGDELAKGLDHDALALEDKWMLSVLSRTAKMVNEHLGNYAFDHAAMAAYDFFWKEFCAYYVEASKPVLFAKENAANKQRMLVIVLCQALRLLHPMAPFITEELFSYLQEKFGGLSSDEPLMKECLEAINAEACMVAPYPQPRAEDIDPKVEAAFDLVQQVIYQVRNIRGEMKVPPGTATDVYLINADALKPHKHLLHALLKIKELSFEEKELPFSSTGVVGEIKILVPLPEELRAQEKGRLEKQKGKLEQSIAGLQGRLSNKEFVDGAPPALVEKTRAQLTEKEGELAEVTSKLSQL